MSMQKMRENTKIILWIVVVAFVVTIFAVWGMDLQTGSGSMDPNVIGKVNDVPISREQYQGLYDQMLKSMTANNPNMELSYAQREIMTNQAWNSIVYNILTREQIERLGIGVSDDEIRYYLRNTPPQEIQQYFLDDKGAFDYQAYQAALNNPDIDWTNLEELARERIPLQKLQTYLQNMVHVSSSEVQRAYEEQNTELTAAYVQFPIAESDIGAYTPTAEEINAYYQDNLDRYSEPEKARLEFVVIDIQPTDADRESTRYKLELVREQMVSGEDFGELAVSYSEAPTAQADGNTGFIKSGQRDDAYFDALVQLTPGTVSQPVQTENGFYLIKLLEQRTAAAQAAEEPEQEYSAQEIFMKISPGYDTIDSLRTLAQQLRDKAAATDLQTAAAEFDLQITAPAAFFQNYPIEGFGFIPKLNDFAFSSETGTLSQVVRDETHFYVAVLTERIAQTVKPLQDVTDAIKRELVEKKKSDLAFERALAFYRSAKATGFEAAATAQGFVVQRQDSFHVSDNLEAFGSYSSFASTAFSISDLAPPVECRGSYYVIKLLNREPFDTEDYQAQMASVGARLYQEKVQEFVAYWYQQMEENAEIEDYRME